MKLFTQSFGSGNPVIILHGLFGMSDNWVTVAKRLSEKYFVLLPDLRNHGRSPHSKEWSYAHMCADILELMDEHSLQGASLIGHSMGGKLAMYFALNHSLRTEKLVVADIAPKKYAPSESHQLVIRALTEIDWKKINSRKEAKEKLSPYGFEEEMIQFILKNFFFENEHYSFRFNLPVIAALIDSIGGEVISEKKFEGKTLFIRGENSDYIKEEDAEKIKTLFPASNLKTISGAGHWVHADKPDEFVSITADFLN